MSTSMADDLDLFSQAACEHLRFQREYAGVLLDLYPTPEVVEQLHQSAQNLSESAGQYGLPLFSGISARIAQVFQYAMNNGIAPESSSSIVEFIQEATALLESDLILLNANGTEAVDDIESFKKKHAYAFPLSGAEVNTERSAPESQRDMSEDLAADFVSASVVESQPEPFPELPEDGEVPDEILECFLAETEEHLQILTECLLALEANPSSKVIDQLFREMHTVKGSAAQVGMQRIAHVAHRAEDLLGHLRDGALQPSPEIVDICLEVVDVVKKFLCHDWPDEEVMRTTVYSLLSRIARVAPVESDENEKHTSVGVASEHQGKTSVSMPLGEFNSQQHKLVDMSSEGEDIDNLSSADLPETVGQGLRVPAQMKELSGSAQSKSVRIPLERLDLMMNVVGALVINRTRILGRLGELERLAEVLNFSKARLIGKIGEFQDRYEFTTLNSGFHGSPPPGLPTRAPSNFMSATRHVDSVQSEFSDLEWDRYDDFNILSRSLSEISADLTEVLTQLGRFVRQVDSDVDEFTNLAHSLQDEISQARMVPVGNLYTRLTRTVRDASKASGKQVELTLEGGETELDNGIIQQISDPLIHLVRNSVAHGIESLSERTENGKPAAGQVAIRAYQRGNQIYIEVEDDGRGIDYEKIRVAAQAIGLVESGAADYLTEEELLEFLFRPGFSTAPKKTDLAGRGVGLDVVRANLAALNGEIAIETEKGKGTRFILKVPLTLIITQALFLRCGLWVFGIPLAFVEEIRRIRPAEIEEVGEKLLTRVRGQVMEVVRLDTRLGLDPLEPVNHFYRMVIVNVGNRQFGIIVEEVLRKDEIVIKGLGEYLRNVKIFPGATIAPDGSLILLLDVNRLVVSESTEHRPSMVQTQAAILAEKAASNLPLEKTILLADDSISVRRFVGKMLERAGYRVKLATDGFEALEIATQGGCDLVLTDLEMPRTNGYELMAHLRQSPITKSLPVIVLTSRAGPKHRDKALREGAAGFLAKPVQEERLLSTVAQFLGGMSMPPQPMNMAAEVGTC